MLTPASELRFFTQADGYRTAARVWETTSPTATIVFLHGIVSHGGWYVETCRALATADIDVHFLDRRGSGLNLPERGDVDSWTTWLADVERYLTRLPQPVYLLGVSWGGKLAAAIARRRPDLIAGVGLICPGLFAKQQPGPLRRTFIRFAAMRTRLSRRRVTIPLADTALFADTETWQDFVRNDPLALRQITLRFAREDLELTNYAVGKPAAISTPALLVLAGRDRIVENEPTSTWFQQLRSEDRTVIEYPTAPHTLEFAAGSPTYVGDLIEWVKTRSARR